MTDQAREIQPFRKFDRRLDPIDRAINGDFRPVAEPLDSDSTESQADPKGVSVTEPVTSSESAQLTLDHAVEEQLAAAAEANLEILTNSGNGKPAS